MSLSTAEDLAAAVLDGSYAPTTAEGCEATLPLDRYPQVVRFAEFTLLGERRPRPFADPRYLIAQPHVLSATSAADQKRELKQHVAPLVRRMLASLPTFGLPRPDAKPVDEIRQALKTLMSDPDPTGRTLERSAGRRQIRVSDVPRLDLPDAELRAAYRDWLAREEDRLVRDRLALLVRYRLAPGLDRPGLAVDADDLVATLGEAAFPGPFQPFAGPFAHIALCAEFEQEWQLVGYTRGELLSSLSLAPGERLTLEIHSWDKTSRKSEDELATESEVRTSEKMTQRDALTVAQEFAKQRNSNVTMNVTVPIPKMPLSLGASASNQTNESLRRTQESMRERTLEAATSLRVNRKTRIEVARETGLEERQTRVIENTNRCHSLNCHHFEIVANYLVRTRLVSVRPCVLLPNPRPEITVDWVLCHADLLIASLLDKIFLPGFDAARLLKTSAVMETMRAERAAAELERTGEDVAPQVTAIGDAWATLTAAKEQVAAAIDDCGSGNSVSGFFCIMDKLTPLLLERTAAWFSLRAPARTALDQLREDQQAGENAAAALRRFLVAIGPSDFVEGVASTGLEAELSDLGMPKWLVAMALKRDPAARDDAGLRAAVEAVRAFVSSAGAAAPQTGDEIGLAEIAAAKVAFDQLRCHIEDNWLHYTNAIWLREDHGQRFLRLQEYGVLVTVIENELLGFYADKAAYPLIRVDRVQDAVDLDDALKGAEKAIAAGPGEPLLIAMPTLGTLLEALTGECDACEDFIRESRVLDLRAQEARSRQEEAEADRRAARVAAGDLSDPKPEPGRLVIELNGLPHAGDGAGGEDD